MDKQEESELIMIAARWEAICDILDGKIPSDFMMSFPEVRKVADLVQQCRCLRASCWHGEFMCDDAQNAGTTLKTIRELRRLNLEHKDNWSAKKLNKVYGNNAPHGYKKID